MEITKICFTVNILVRLEHFNLLHSGNGGNAFNVVQQLIRNGSVNSVDDNGYSALHWAAIKGKTPRIPFGFLS